MLSAIVGLLRNVGRTGPDHDTTGDTPGVGVATLPVGNDDLLYRCHITNRTRFGGTFRGFRTARRHEPSHSTTQRSSVTTGAARGVEIPASGYDGRDGMGVGRHVTPGGFEGIFASRATLGLASTKTEMRPK